jgi:Tfp pilus assembly protein PilN
LKPIHVNLAATPYRDYRPLYAVVVVASVLIAFLMLNNIDTYYRYTRETRTTRERIAGIESQIANERRRAEAAVAQTRTMDLVTLGKQTKFINAQLAERAFSWGELLDRLEDVIPPDVRITSIAPTFSENGLVHLNMACEAKTDTGLTTAISRFQRSPYFANPFPTSENLNAGAYQFGLGVDYKPSIPRVVTK